MRKIVLTFGLIAGAVMSVMMVIAMMFQDQIGFDRGAIVGYTSMVAAFLMIFFGIRAYRDQVGGGTIGFGRAFGIGMLITLIGTVCYVATWEVIYFKFMPDFGDKYAAYSIQKLKASGASEQQVAAQQKAMDQFKEMYKNPLVNAAMTFVEPLPVGVIMTLIAAGVLRRRRRPGESPEPVRA